MTEPEPVRIQKTARKNRRKVHSKQVFEIDKDFSNIFDDLCIERIFYHLSDLLSFLFSELNKPLCFLSIIFIFNSIANCFCDLVKICFYADHLLGVSIFTYSE